MPENKIIQIVASGSTPEKEEAFSHWYSEIHLPMLFGFEGVKRASRYKLMGDNPNLAKYMAVYEFETPEDMAAFAKSPAMADAIVDFDARKEELGIDIKWSASYECIKTLSR